jgi:hypothetical protein
VESEFQNVPATKITQYTTLPNNLKLNFTTYFFERDTFRDYEGLRLDVSGRGMKINIDVDNLSRPEAKHTFVQLEMELLITVRIIINWT